ncbi:MAG: hypothetical protein RLZZ283_598, partial [Candidatus Parcubacteria bacterium]
GATHRTQERILIDYSGKSEGRVRDVRVRCTDGVSEFMIKLGTYGAEDHRTEYGVKVGEHQFDACVGVMHALGYDEGNLCHFKNEIVSVGGIDIVLKSIPGFPERGLIEADIEVANEGDIPAARETLQKLFRNNGIEPHTDASFIAYVDGLEGEVFPRFRYSEYTPGYFAKTFGI